jgi:hypothetical protein
MEKRSEFVRVHLDPKSHFPAELAGAAADAIVDVIEPFIGIASLRVDVEGAMRVALDAAGLTTADAAEWVDSISAPHYPLE